jgi:hypothetical protein
MNTPLIPTSISIPPNLLCSICQEIIELAGRLTERAPIHIDESSDYKEKFRELIESLYSIRISLNFQDLIIFEDIIAKIFAHKTMDLPIPEDLYNELVEFMSKILQENSTENSESKLTNEVIQGLKTSLLQQIIELSKKYVDPNELKALRNQYLNDPKALDYFSTFNYKKAKAIKTDLKAFINFLINYFIPGYHLRPDLSCDQISLDELKAYYTVICSELNNAMESLNLMITTMLDVDSTNFNENDKSKMKTKFEICTATIEEINERFKILKIFTSIFFAQESAEFQAPEEQIFANIDLDKITVENLFKLITRYPQHTGQEFKDSMISIANLKAYCQTLLDYIKFSRPDFYQQLIDLLSANINQDPQELMGAINLYFEQLIDITKQALNQK